jgi:hypothetical protein
MKNHQLINQDSKDFEYYTDPGYTCLARSLLNGIELDPASSTAANRFVRAERIYAIDDDGLSKPWNCRSLWMNHPFSRGEAPCPKDRKQCKKKVCKDRGYHIDTRIPSNKEWIDKLVQSFKTGAIRGEALNITYAATSEAWFRPLQQYPQLYIVPRCNYFLPNGKIKKGVTKGSVITFLTREKSRVHDFQSIFGNYGEVHVPYSFIDFWPG